MKKKYVKTTAVYAVLAMAAGVFYREYTKAMGFDGVTMLSKVHAYLFLTGMGMWLLTGLCAAVTEIEKQKTFRPFQIVYSIGVSLTAVMMFVRGILQVNGTVLSDGMNGMVSGFAGIGHICLGIGILLFLKALYDACKD